MNMNNNMPEFGSRLNVVTGPNGYGKTRLLNRCWDRLNYEAQCIYAKDDGEFLVRLGSFAAHIKAEALTMDSLWSAFTDWYYQGRDPIITQAVDAICPGLDSFSVYSSSRARRIFCLLYLIRINYGICREQGLMTLLIDDIEMHLHPQWQRLVLPAILQMVKDISISIIVTTHSPLVLASLEPHFDERRDKAFHFSLVDCDKIALHERVWLKHGNVTNWLTSDTFGLKQARSIEAEQAIEAAKNFMSGESLANFPAHLQSKHQIHQELLRTLPGHDHFWPRWVVKYDPKFAQSDK